MNNNAFQYACYAHAGQLRNDGQPYIVHPVRVFNILYQLNVSEQSILDAALLHDVIEDCNVNYQELASLFGIRTANLVQELTYTPSSDKLSREEKFNEKFANIKLMSDEALLIKAADRLDNINDFNGSRKWQQKYFDESLKIYDFMRLIKLNSTFNNMIFDEIKQQLSFRLMQINDTILGRYE